MVVKIAGRRTWKKCPVCGRSLALQLTGTRQAVAALCPFHAGEVLRDLATYFDNREAAFHARVAGRKSFANVCEGIADKAFFDLPEAVRELVRKIKEEVQP
jgi:hypothetical protein